MTEIALSRVDGLLKIPFHKDYILSEPRIRAAENPKKVVLLVPHHTPMVKAGDTVLCGQIIAEGVLPIHATVSGVITAVGQSIEIEADGKNLSVDSFGVERADSEIESLSPENFQSIAIENSVADLRNTEVIIFNGSESEPYLTSDYLLMLSKPVEILRGVEYLLRATGAREAVIAIAEDKRECYEIFASKLFTHKIQKIRLQWLKDSYPQGFDVQLKAQILGKPNEQEVAIFSIPQAFAFFEAVKFRKPFIERVVTVAGGCVMQPQNIWARFGTSIQNVFDQCGGFLRFPSRVIMNGPMTGIAQDTLNVPVTREMAGVLAFPKEDNILQEAEPCIRCGDCIPVCPVSINPAAIIDFALKADWKHAAEFYPQDCVACGNCSYVCPSKITVMDLVIQAKEAICPK